MKYNTPAGRNRLASAEASGRRRPVAHPVAAVYARFRLHNPRAPADEESFMPDVSVRLAGEADRPVLERLWLLFRHDMSEFTGALPYPDGTFRSERLEAALSGTDDWAPYLILSADRPVGLAFVRALTTSTRVLNSFFVVRGARRAGTGLRAVSQVVARHPGSWEVAFQDANAAAVSFWRKVATEIAGDAWTETRRPVPGLPDAPPDVWIAFHVPG
jgi:predicted acetyltransferase